MIDTIEDIFSHNEYNGLDVLPFRIVSGIGNTIISAPHSVRQKLKHYNLNYQKARERILI
jgi:hypothetical protein